MRELSIISAQRLNGAGGTGYITGVRCFFTLLGLRAGNYWSTLDYMEWLSIQQKEFCRTLRRSGEKPEDFWMAFDHWLEERVSGDSYIIYKPLIAQHQAPLSALKKWGLSVDDRNYKIVWSSPLDPEQDDIATLDHLKQAGYEDAACRSVEVGDIIVLSQGGKRAAWFLDTHGFVKLRGFEKMKWRQEEKKGD